MSVVRWIPRTSGDVRRARPQPGQHHEQGKLRRAIPAGRSCSSKAAGDRRRRPPSTTDRRSGPSRRMRAGDGRGAIEDDTTAVSTLSRYGIESKTRPQGRAFRDPGSAAGLLPGLPRLVVAGGARAVAGRQRRAGRSPGAGRAGQVGTVRLPPRPRHDRLLGRRQVVGVVDPAVPGRRRCARPRRRRCRSPSAARSRAPDRSCRPWCG